MGTGAETSLDWWWLEQVSSEQSRLKTTGVAYFALRLRSNNNTCRDGKREGINCDLFRRLGPLLFHRLAASHGQSSQHLEEALTHWLAFATRHSLEAVASILHTLYNLQPLDDKFFSCLANVGILPSLRRLLFHHQAVLPPLFADSKLQRQAFICASRFLRPMHRDAFLSQDEGGWSLLGLLCHLASTARILSSRSPIEHQILRQGEVKQCGVEEKGHSKLGTFISSLFSEAEEMEEEWAQLSQYHYLLSSLIQCAHAAASPCHCHDYLMKSLKDVEETKGVVGLDEIRAARRLVAGAHSVEGVEKLRWEAEKGDLEGLLRFLRAQTEDGLFKHRFAAAATLREAIALARDLGLPY